MRTVGKMAVALVVASIAMGCGSRPAHPSSGAAPAVVSVGDTEQAATDVMAYVAAHAAGHWDPNPAHGNLDGAYRQDYFFEPDGGVSSAELDRYRDPRIIDGWTRRWARIGELVVARGGLLLTVSPSGSQSLADLVGGLVNQGWRIAP